MDFYKKISKDWALTTVLFIMMATMVFTSVYILRVSQSNQRFLTNFSNFMQCLIVSDPEVVKALGKEAYFNECNKLLLDGTGVKLAPITKVTAPPTTTTSGG